MTSHTKHLLAALLVVGLAALAGNPAAAQTEMTSKIRLECAAGSAECPGAAAQWDFSVTGQHLGLFRTDGSGRVGIRTNTPQGQLHIFGTAGSDIFAGMGPEIGTPGVGPGFNYGYAGASFGTGAGFFNVRPGGGSAAPNPSLRFMTGDMVRMTIDNEGFIGVGINEAVGAGGFNPLHPIHQKTTNAHLSAAGVWVSASSRALKENIVALSGAEALEALSKLEPVKYDYKVAPADGRVGFIAEDVPELVAEPDRQGLSPLDIVGVLARVVKDHEQTIAELRAEIAAIKQQQNQ